MPPVSRGALQLSSLLRQSRASPARASFVCNRCILSLAPPPPPPSRSFVSSTRALKKSSANPKSSKKAPKTGPPDVERHVPDNQATRSRDAEIDPYDHSELQAGIDRALARLHDALSRTRDAGRVSPEMLESLPVELPVKDTPGGSTHKETARLGDVASVVPKGGRSLQIYAAEAAHVKALCAAVQASAHSLTPQAAGPDDSNPLCITVPIPPVTAETRRAAAAEAKKCLERAQLDVRNARGEAQKRFRKMELQKLVVVDELRKAHKGMEDVVKKGSDEAKKVHDAAVRALER